ncbi:MAG TPA: NAD(P)-dependent oxidoreductase [Alphaproteobacteria bacterium]|nr:NAD(P)-dependent oxidoreductase [Alphaproteobacteria bacterium]
MRILVTGGAGFLGGAFAVRARDAGHTVTTLDRAGDVDHRCDIGDPDEVEAAVLAASPEAVLHLAALLTDASAVDPVASARVNALGTAAVFSAAMKAQASRVIYAGSIAAVGACAEGSGDDVPLMPRSVYGASKAFGEHLARALSATPGGPRFLVLRFGWIYGPGRARGWRDAQTVIEQFATGEPIVAYPDFCEPIDWTYLDDAVEVLLHAVTRPLPAFAAFNVAGDRRMMKEAVAYLQKRFPHVRAQPVPAPLPPSGWGIRNDGLDAALGFAPVTRLEAGIDAMLAAIGPMKATRDGSNREGTD